MSMEYFLESCCTDVEQIRRAQEAGARRIELCEKLAVGGVTPSAELLKWGFTKEYGAREMDRVIGNRLKPILMKALLFGKLKKGGKAHVDFDGKELVINY